MNPSLNWLFNSRTYVLIQESSISENYIKNHWMTKFIKNGDKLLYQVGLTDRDLLLQYDEIFVDFHNVYWQSPRMGEIYPTDNGGVESRKSGGTIVLNKSEIERWNMVCSQNLCYLEANMKNGRIHKTLELPESEILALNGIQIRMNELTCI